MTDLSALWGERERLLIKAASEGFAVRPGDQQEMLLNRLLSVTDELADAVPVTPEESLIKVRLLREYAEQLDMPDQNYITRIARSLDAALTALCSRAPPGHQSAA